MCTSLSPKLCLHTNHDYVLTFLGIPAVGGLGQMTEHSLCVARQWTMSTSPLGDLAKLAVFINVSIPGSGSLNPLHMTEGNVFYYCMYMCAHMCVHARRGKCGGQKTVLWSWFSPSTFTRVLEIILHRHRANLIHLANFTQLQIRSGSFTATNL